MRPGAWPSANRFPPSLATWWKPARTLRTLRPPSGSARPRRWPRAWVASWSGTAAMLLIAGPCAKPTPSIALDRQATDLSGENVALTAGLHEEFSREHGAAPASNKRFGLVVGAI